MTVSSVEGKSKMKVSVIIPVYNREEMVINAVSSVLDQSFSNLECIVFDDGSTDASREAVDSISDPRLKVFSGANGGVSSARNRAISKADGEYIALLDSDDTWLPDKLDIQLEYMAENGYEISQTDEAWFRNGKKVKKGKRNRKIEGRIFDNSLQTCLISPSCTVFSREIWDKFGPFDELMPAYEDFDFWINICRYYPIGLIDKELTVRNGGREDQLTSKVLFPDIYRIYALLKLLKKTDLSVSEFEAVSQEIERKLGYFCGGCFKRGRDEYALKVSELVTEIKENPESEPSELLEFLNSDL
ncbi:glycosyltransferase family 2 protein [Maridesulfovibrio bastinii]|uniref:glycosyltransferase family 2 protein n=1 Tax=Maridesulfovibrio bastinii TaxID=47157 RepID=UPI000686C3F0|nr:glycosyltransferase family A protein [Maridesulfovibrio bastinii]